MSVQQAVELERYFKEHPGKIAALVPFEKWADRIYPFDFTVSNTELNATILEDTDLFSKWISRNLQEHGCRYGVGGYNEHRTIYSRSDLFDTNEEPRRLHLGVDIWGEAGTPVFSPIDGIIHSFKFNDNFGDYGATIIIEHRFNGIHFHTLYGHLNLASIHDLVEGKSVSKGQKIAEFGNIIENGHWPPHLHFQLIFDLEDMEGDYPGVCPYSQRETYLSNCPDPEMIIKHTFGYQLP